MASSESAQRAYWAATSRKPDSSDDSAPLQNFQHDLFSASIMWHLAFVLVKVHYRCCMAHLPAATCFLLRDAGGGLMPGYSTCLWLCLIHTSHADWMMLYAGQRTSL